MERARPIDLPYITQHQASDKSRHDTPRQTANLCTDAINEG